MGEIQKLHPGSSVLQYLRNGGDGALKPSPLLVMWMAEIKAARNFPNMELADFWGAKGVTCVVRVRNDWSEPVPLARRRVEQKAKAIKEMPLFKDHVVFIQQSDEADDIGSIGMLIQYPAPVAEVVATFAALCDFVQKPIPEYLEFRCVRNCPIKDNTSPTALCPGGGPCRFSKSYLDSQGRVYRLWYNNGYGWRAIRMNPDKPLMKEELEVFSPRNTFDQAQGDLNRVARAMSWHEYNGTE